MNRHCAQRLCFRRVASFAAAFSALTASGCDDAGRRNARRLLGAAVAGLALGTLLFAGPRAGAQTGTPPVGGANGLNTPPGNAKKAPTDAPKSPPSKSEGDAGAHEAPSLDSVNSDVLASMRDQEVRVQGIIGDYHQTTKRYEFRMDDGSHVEVIGTYPSVSHVRYTLNARVIRESPQYVLSEISKERVDTAGGSGSGVKVDPLLLAGGLLLVAAAGIFIMMTARSKAAAQKQGVEQQIEQERRKAEAARLEAERLRAAATRSPAEPGPGGTVVTSAPAPQSSKATPARTIVSIGAVEVIAGPHQGQKFPLQPGETRLGRAVKDGIALDRDGEVSSQHGSLIVTVDGHVLYRDESTNGSILDGSTVHHRQVEAHSGSQLEVGASTLRITLRAPSASPVSSVAPPQAVVGSPAGAGGGAPLKPEPAVVPAAAAAAPQGSRSAATVAIEMPATWTKAPAPPTQASLGAELEVLSGPDAGQRFAITRSVMGMGREDQDILLNDDSVSRKHATLVYRDGKFLLTDQRSTHGTKVNGESIGSEARELTNGDRITPGTGQTTLLFHSLSS